jgi:hypothetical protein
MREENNNFFPSVEDSAIGNALRIKATLALCDEGFW